MAEYTKLTLRGTSNLDSFQASLPSPAAVNALCNNYPIKYGFNVSWPPVATFVCDNFIGTYPVTLSARFQSADCDYDMASYLR